MDLWLKNPINSSYFPKFQWYSAALMDGPSVLRAGKDPSRQRQEKQPWNSLSFQPGNCLTHVSQRSRTFSVSDGRKPAPSCDSHHNPSHTCKGRVIPFCHPSSRDPILELHFSSPAPLRTVHMSSHGSCSPLWISCICSSLDGTFLTL